MANQPVNNYAAQLFAQHILRLLSTDTDLYGWHCDNLYTSDNGSRIDIELSLYRPLMDYNDTQVKSILVTIVAKPEAQEK